MGCVRLALSVACGQPAAAGDDLEVDLAPRGLREELRKLRIGPAMLRWLKLRRVRLYPTSAGRWTRWLATGTGRRSTG